MARELNIEYLVHHEIDKIQWDQCLQEADNGLIYGRSFYLDRMAKHWDGLVLDDYESVMPLTWNEKFGIHYLYQPSFTASLGVFGKHLNGEIVHRFIKAIPKKFQFIEISLNSGNNFSDASLPFTFSRANYILHLDRGYEDLYECYRENHQRNIRKASQYGCTIKTTITIEEVIALNRAQMANKPSLTDDDCDRFKKLYEVLRGENKAFTYGTVDPEGKLLASCVFFVSYKRAYYILAGNHPDSRSTGASHALIDTFIRDHAGKDLILDFEGSDVESLALFYAGFGASKETYPAVRWNRLPWYLKWLKR